MNKYRLRQLLVVIWSCQNMLLGAANNANVCSG
jgi:hypothetical protein